MTLRHAAVVVMIVAVCIAAVQPSAAEARVHWWVGIGPFWWPYPYGWYPGPYYYAPPPVVVVEPPVYVEMPPPERYWYYCRPSQAYYPYVASCAEPWIQVPAAPP